MQHQRHRHDLADLAQALHIQLGSSLVDAVGSADGDSQRIDAGALCKLSSLGGDGVAVAITAVKVVFLAADLAQLSLHRDTGGVAGADNGLGDLDVLLKHMVRAVDHDGGVAGTECLHGQLIAAAVVEVHHDGDAGLRSGCGHHGVEHGRRSILQGTRGGLDDDRSAQLLSSGDDGLHHLHVLGIERADGVMVLLSVEHQIFGRN